MTEATPKYIANLINARRLALNWTQRQLADAAGLHQPNVSRAMAGHMTSTTLDKLIHAMGGNVQGDMVVWSDPTP